MAQTLKDLLTTVLLEVGFQPLSQYAANQTNEAQQLIRLANRQLAEQAKDDWNELHAQLYLTMSTDTLYPLPLDWRQFIPDGAWTEVNRVNFPASGDVWNYCVSSGITTTVYIQMRLAGGKIEILSPAPDQTILMSYVSSYPVRSATAEPKPTFTADTDTFVLSDTLFTLGVIWRFMRAKGLDGWETSFQEYTNMYKRERATNNGSQTINTANGEWEGPYPPTINLWAS